GAILRLGGVRLPAAPLPPGAQRLAVWGHRAALGLSPVRRALLIGLLSTLLPCGWLYAFAVTAAGTASPVAGAATMAVFWVGTLPVLISLGVGVQKLSGALGRRLPLLTSLALVVVGVLCIAGRVTAPAMARPAAPVDGSLEAAVEHVEHLDAASMPCCQHASGD
ncbi:MAG: sulfite exporter TauE/SafE family protein, partial [Planctomycetota bacterium]